jgi:hypothetical protein
LITKYPKDKDGQISAEVWETQLELKNLIWLDSVFKIMDQVLECQEKTEKALHQWSLELLESGMTSDERSRIHLQLVGVEEAVNTEIFIKTSFN